MNGEILSIDTVKRIKELENINENHKKLNGELRKEVNKYKEIIDKAIEYTNKNWASWGTNVFTYNTKLLEILEEKEV